MHMLGVHATVGNSPLGGEPERERGPDDAGPLDEPTVDTAG
jgi:hypothetical protein